MSHPDLDRATLVRYRSLRHWRFRLEEDYRIATGLLGFQYDAPRALDPGAPRFASLSEGGLLTIPAGYAWDGPSGPVPAWESSLRPSLVHDALYQLIRIGALPTSCRDEVDELFHALCLEAGMRPWLARCFYLAVRWFGRSAATEDEPYPAVRIAP